MPKESNLEFKVGLFVLIAIIGLIMFIFSVSDSSVLEKGKSVNVVFGFANGLKKSAPVRIAGVDEGIVEEIGNLEIEEDSPLVTYREPRKIRSVEPSQFNIMRVKKKKLPKQSNKENIARLSDRIFRADLVDIVSLRESSDVLMYLGMIGESVKVIYAQSGSLPSAHARAGETPAVDSQSALSAGRRWPLRGRDRGFRPRRCGCRPGRGGR